MGAFLFSVEAPGRGRHRSGVPDSRPINSKPDSPVKVTTANKVFWARPANAELDRSGEWLLKKLIPTRAGVATRAGPV